jgi:hypothetical protein
VSDHSSGGSERDPQKVASEVYDEFAKRLDDGDDPYEVLDVAITVLANEWESSLSTDNDRSESDE